MFYEVFVSDLSSGYDPIIHQAIQVLFQNDAEWQMDHHEQQQFRAGQQKTKQTQGMCQASLSMLANTTKMTF